MKTKEEILKMSKKDLEIYKWSDYLEYKKENKGCSFCFNCSGCSFCFNCSGCSGCSGCSFCYLCRNAKGLNYAICNVEMSKEEYEAKMKELKG